MDNFRIVKIAYRVTIAHPGLWLLGIFIGTGFNIQLILWQSFNISSVLSWDDLLYAPALFRGYPILAVVIPAIFMVGILILLAATNWAKAVLILRLCDILKLQNKDFILESSAQVQGKDKPAAVQSIRFIPRLILVSLFTTAVMILTLIFLSIPFVDFVQRSANENFIVFLTFIVFAAAVFIISIVSAFASFAVVLLRFNVRSAMNLGAEMLVRMWREIIVVVLLFSCIYYIAYLAGFYTVTALYWLLDIYLGGVALWAKGVLLWGWLSVLSTFFYTAMLLLFVHLVRPKAVYEDNQALAIYGV